MRWRSIVVLLFSVSGCAGGADVPTTPDATENGQVDMRNFDFIPRTVVIKLNGRVTWTNYDSTLHNATGAGFTATADFGAGESEGAEFKTRGTFPYRCSLHSAMTGIVVVQ